MAQESTSVDELYLNAEDLAQDFSLFPQKQPDTVIKGLLSEKQIEVKLEQLRNMEVDAYIAATVAPTEESTRPGARAIVDALNVPVSNVIEMGPFYCAELSMQFGDAVRKIGLIAQDRAHASGVCLRILSGGTIFRGRNVQSLWVFLPTSFIVREILMV